MMRLRLRRPLLALLALLLAATLPSHADPADEARDHFKLAMDAVEQRSWAEAELQLRRAVALDPLADKRTFAKDYLPHYWLGVALQEQGKCRAALQSWDEARSQGEAPDSRDALDMPRRRKVCEEAVDKIEAAVGEAQNAIGQARRADRALARLADAPELAAHWAPFENRRQAALESLVEAERRLERADQAEDLDAVREVADDASQVGSRLHTIAADARSKAGQVSSASARAQGDLDEAEAAASSALRAVQALEPLPPELEAQAMEVRRLLEEVDEVRRRARPSVTRSHSRELAEAIRGLKNLALPPPTWLADAAQDYLDQDFDASLEILDRALGRAPGQAEKAADEEEGNGEPAEASEAGDEAEVVAESDRERFHALLLAAAARHQLWIAGGEEDEEMRRRVSDDLGAAVDLQSADAESSLGRPSPRFLSPRFRALWVEAGGMAVEESAATQADPASDDTAPGDAP